MSDTHENLAAALAAFQANMPVVAKTKTATVPTKSGGSYSYTYAGLADVTSIALPKLAEHGLSFTTHPRANEAGGYELVGVLRHTSGDRDEGSLPLRNGSPQEVGGAITYARRYLLGAMTGIVTEDDDDGQTASTGGKGKSKSASGKRSMSRPSSQPRETGEAPSDKARNAMFAGLKEIGLTDRDQILTYVSDVTGATITTSKDLTDEQVTQVLAAIDADRKASDDALEGPR